MPMLETREYRSMPVMSVREAGAAESFVVEGYATTFDEEYPLYQWPDYEVWEKIDPHAFDECDMRDVIMQYDHRGRVFARIRNGTLSLAVDAHGLKCTADLGGTDIGRQLYQEISGGYTDRMSFGFVVGEDEKTEVHDRVTGKVRVLRTITKIAKLYDTSVVSLPANEGTEISARSADGGVPDWVTAERRKAAEKARARELLKLRLRLEEV